MSVGVTSTAAVTSSTAAVTAADDLPEPFAALSLICVTALAVSAVLRLVQRLETAERELADERRHRATIESEYASLTEDYNALAVEHAERATRGREEAEHAHGPRCRCRPYLSLVDQEPRQGSA